MSFEVGISELGALSFQEVASGAYPLELATQHPVYPNLRFLTAPMNCPAEEIDREAFRAMLDAARRQFDYVLLDAPAGIDAGFDLAARYVDRIIMVTGPDPAAVRDAARAAQILDAMGKSNVRLIVNRINKKMAAAMNITVDDIMDRAALPLLGVVPEDENVVLAAAFRQPLLGFTSKGAALACRRIARRIRGMSVAIRL